MEPATTPAPRLMSTTKRKQPCTRLERPWIRTSYCWTRPSMPWRWPQLKRKQPHITRKSWKKNMATWCGVWFFMCFQTCFGQSGQQISTNGGNTLDSNHVSMYFQELTIQKLSPEGVPNLGTCSHWGDEKKGLEMLMKVRSAILSFYGSLVAPPICITYNFFNASPLLCRTGSFSYIQWHSVATGNEVPLVRLVRPKRGDPRPPDMLPTLGES